jgi:hypothetical protein
MTGINGVGSSALAIHADQTPQRGFKVPGRRHQPAKKPTRATLNAPRLKPSKPEVGVYTALEILKANQYSLEREISRLRRRLHDIEREDPLLHASRRVFTAVRFDDPRQTG